MKVTLTHELKVQLLQAIQQGELDTDIFSEQKGEPMTFEEINAEIIRLELLDGKNLIGKRADIMKQYAEGKINTEEFTDKTLKLRQFGIRKSEEKLVISLKFCIFVVENQLNTKIESDDYQGQSYRNFLCYRRVLQKFRRGVAKELED